MLILINNEAQSYRLVQSLFNYRNEKLQDVESDHNVNSNLSFESVWELHLCIKLMTNYMQKLCADNSQNIFNVGCLDGSID